MKGVIQDLLSKKAKYEDRVEELKNQIEDFEKKLFDEETALLDTNKAIAILEAAEDEDWNEGIEISDDDLPFFSNVESGGGSDE